MRHVGAPASRRPRTLRRPRSGNSSAQAGVKDGLPERIAAVRHRLGLSQCAFAARAGIARNVVLRFEGGHGRPRADTLERIAGSVASP